MNESCLRIWRGLWVGLLAMILAGGTQAQTSDLTLLLHPERNEFTLDIRDSLRIYTSEGVEDSPHDFRAMMYDLSLRYPLILNEEHELYVGTDFDWIDLDTDARLGGSGGALPSDLYDLNLTLGYRRWLENGWKTGGMLQLGSASDRLFNSWDETYLKGTAFLQVPHLEYTAWMFFLNADSDRDIPVVPGFAYMFPVSRQALAVVGLPVVAVAGNFGEKISFQAGYLPIRNANVKLGYSPIEELTFSLAFDWRTRFFNRADRDSSSDRIEFEEKRATAGLSWDITQRANIGVEAGYAFGRQIGEGDKRSDRNRNRILIEDGWFGGAQFQYRF